MKDLPSISNYGILNPVPTDPSGYMTKDGVWCAVEMGQKYVILKDGKQVHVANSYSTAKTYIQKQVKTKPKRKKSTSSLDQFL